MRTLRISLAIHYFNKGITMKFAKYLLVFGLFIFAGQSFSKTVTITFGNYFFSPKTIDVSVGDVIVWTGDFTMHQIQSTSVPSGAAAFGPTPVSGSASLSYTV